MKKNLLPTNIEGAFNNSNLGGRKLTPEISVKNNEGMVCKEIVNM